ncbi:MAG: ribonuclease P [archaeon]|nr:ribonuclease P [archaeon]
MKHTKMQQIGLERIYRLFELAEQEMKNPKRSKRYIKLAIEIGKKTRVRFPSELKEKFCKKCNSFLNKTNSETKKTETMKIIKCKDCGFERKTGLKPKQ